MIIDRKNTETAYIFIYSNVFKTDRLCIQYKNGWVSYCFCQVCGPSPFYKRHGKIPVEFIPSPRSPIPRAVFGDRYKRV